MKLKHILYIFLTIISFTQFKHTYTSSQNQNLSQKITNIISGSIAVHYIAPKKADVSLVKQLSSKMNQDKENILAQISKVDIQTLNIDDLQKNINEYIDMFKKGTQKSPKHITNNKTQLKILSIVQEILENLKNIIADHEKFLTGPSENLLSQVQKPVLSTTQASHPSYSMYQASNDIFSILNNAFETVKKMSLNEYKQNMISTIKDDIEKITDPIAKEKLYKVIYNQKNLLETKLKTFISDINDTKELQNNKEKTFEFRSISQQKDSLDRALYILYRQAISMLPNDIKSLKESKDNFQDRENKFKRWSQRDELREQAQKEEKTIKTQKPTFTKPTFTKKSPVIKEAQQSTITPPITESTEPVKKGKMITIPKFKVPTQSKLPIANAKIKIIDHIVFNIEENYLKQQDGITGNLKKDLLKNTLKDEGKKELTSTISKLSKENIIKLENNLSELDTLLDTYISQFTKGYSSISDIKDTLSIPYSDTQDIFRTIKNILEKIDINIRAYKKEQAQKVKDAKKIIPTQQAKDLLSDLTLSKQEEESAIKSLVNILQQASEDVRTIITDNFKKLQKSVNKYIKNLKENKIENAEESRKILFINENKVTFEKAQATINRIFDLLKQLAAPKLPVPDIQLAPAPKLEAATISQGAKRPPITQSKQSNIETTKRHNKLIEQCFDIVYSAFAKADQKIVLTDSLFDHIKSVLNTFVGNMLTNTAPNLKKQKEKELFSEIEKYITEYKENIIYNLTAKFLLKLDTKSDMYVPYINRSEAIDNSYVKAIYENSINQLFYRISKDFAYIIDTSNFKGISKSMLTPPAPPKPKSPKTADFKQKPELQTYTEERSHRSDQADVQDNKTLYKGGVVHERTEVKAPKPEVPQQNISKVTKKDESPKANEWVPVVDKDAVQTQQVHEARLTQAQENIAARAEVSGGAPGRSKKKGGSKKRGKSASKSKKTKPKKSKKKKGKKKKGGK